MTVRALLLVSGVVLSTHAFSPSSYRACPPLRSKMTLARSAPPQPSTEPASEFGFTSVDGAVSAPSEGAADSALSVEPSREWGDFRAVKIPMNREEMIFAFMQYAKCERLQAQDEVDAFLARPQSRELWKQMQTAERANPMPEPPTEMQKILVQVRSGVRALLFVGAGYYVSGPAKELLAKVGILGGGGDA